MRKRTPLPRAIGAFVVFEAVVDDDAGDIFFGVAWEEADFGELASEGDEFSAKDAATFARRTCREGERQIAHGRRGEGVREACRW